MDSIMEAIRRYFKVQLPRYLKGLPLPKTFYGFTKLTQQEWLYLAPLFLTIGIILASLFAGGGSGKSSKKKIKTRVNTGIKLDQEKVVDFQQLCDVEDIVSKDGGACKYCRCWKSKKFPFCDGSHVKHNKSTGDNVGPLIIKKSD